jgi:hypothetical protein
MVMNWSQDNLRQSPSQENKVNNVVIYSYQDPSLLLSLVVDDRFRDFVGSKSLFDQKNAPFFKAPNLLDEARVCLDSSGGKIPPNFGRQDFPY